MSKRRRVVTTVAKQGRQRTGTLPTRPELLTDVLLDHCLTHLWVSDLARMTRVCRQWQRAVHRCQSRARGLEICIGDPVDSPINYRWLALGIQHPVFQRICSSLDSLVLDVAPVRFSTSNRMVRLARTTLIDMVQLPGLRALDLTDVGVDVWLHRLLEALAQTKDRHGLRALALPWQDFRPWNKQAEFWTWLVTHALPHLTHLECVSPAEFWTLAPQPPSSIALTCLNLHIVNDARLARIWLDTCRSIMPHLRLLRVIVFLHDDNNDHDHDRPSHIVNDEVLLHACLLLEKRRSLESFALEDWSNGRLWHVRGTTWTIPHHHNTDTTSNTNTNTTDWLTQLSALEKRLVASRVQDRSPETAAALDHEPGLLG